MQDWLAVDLPARFDRRSRPVGEAVALEWARLTGAGDRLGRPTDACDALIGATALVLGLMLATCDTRGCVNRGIAVSNPWQD